MFEQDAFESGEWLDEQAVFQDDLCSIEAELI